MAPQRSGIGRTDAFCSVLVSSLLSVHSAMRHELRSISGVYTIPLLSHSLTLTFIIPPSVNLSIHPFFISIIFFLIFVNIFGGVEMVQRDRRLLAMESD